MRFLRIALMTAAVLVTGISPVVSAEGFYVGLGGGSTDVGWTKFTLNSPVLPAVGELSFGDTGAFDVTAGYKFWFPIRFETEILYADYIANELVQDGAAPFPLHGDVENASLFANAVWDIPLWDQLSASIGGGVGGAWFDPRIADAVQDRITGSQTEFTRQNGTVGRLRAYARYGIYRYGWLRQPQPGPLRTACRGGETGDDIRWNGCLADFHCGPELPRSAGADGFWRTRTTESARGDRSGWPILKSICAKSRRHVTVRVLRGAT